MPPQMMLQYGGQFMFVFNHNNKDTFHWFTNNHRSTWCWCQSHVLSLIFITLPTRSSGRRYSVLLQKFLSSFFSFAKGSLRWRYRQGTFIAQKVGYRCNFIKLVRNLGADPPLKFGGPKTPISVNFRTISNFAGPLVCGLV